MLKRSVLMLVALLMVGTLLALPKFKPLPFNTNGTKRAVAFEGKKYFFYRAEKGKDLQADLKNGGHLVLACMSKKDLPQVQFTVVVDGVKKEFTAKRTGISGKYFLYEVSHLELNPRQAHRLNLNCTERNAYFRLFLQ